MFRLSVLLVVFALRTAYMIAAAGTVQASNIDIFEISVPRESNQFTFFVTG